MRYTMREISLATTSTRNLIIARTRYTGFSGFWTEMRLLRHWTDWTDAKPLS